jgi:hypothetical protein
VIDDRTVHARGCTGLEVVRYERAGKWYLEASSHNRVSVTLAVAAERAADLSKDGGEVFLGLPGGSRFDIIVRRHLRLHPRATCDRVMS